MKKEKVEETKESEEAYIAPLKVGSIHIELAPPTI